MEYSSDLSFDPLTSTRPFDWRWSPGPQVYMCGEWFWMSTIFPAPLSRIHHLGLYVFGSLWTHHSSNADTCRWSLASTSSDQIAWLEGTSLDSCWTLVPSSSLTTCRPAGPSSLLRSCRAAAPSSLIRSCRAAAPCSFDNFKTRLMPEASTTPRTLLCWSSAACFRYDMSTCRQLLMSIIWHWFVLWPSMPRHVSFHLTKFMPVWDSLFVTLSIEVTFARPWIPCQRAIRLHVAAVHETAEDDQALEKILEENLVL